MPITTLPGNIPFRDEVECYIKTPRKYCTCHQINIIKINNAYTFIQYHYGISTTRMSFNESARLNMISNTKICAGCTLWLVKEGNNLCSVCRRKLRLWNNTATLETARAKRTSSRERSRPCRRFTAEQIATIVDLTQVTLSPESTSDIIIQEYNSS